MSKSTFATIIAIAASLCLLHISTAEEPAVPPAHRRPNIVLIIADDLGWNDVGYHGSEIRTPRIDALAAQGVVFDRFCAFPTCTPKRVAILAGRSPLVLGMHGPLEPHDAGVSREEKMLAEILRAAGYQTFLAGKWHLGSNHVRDWPQSRGFDHFCGNLTGGIGYRDKIHAGHYDWQRGALPRWALAGAPARQVVLACSGPDRPPRKGSRCFYIASTSGALVRRGLLRSGRLEHFSRTRGRPPLSLGSRFELPTICPPRQILSRHCFHSSGM